MKSNKLAGVRTLTMQTNQKAREAMDKPQPEIKRTTIKRGIMEATIYPATGSVLLKMDSGTGAALTYEEAAALRDLLNEQLPDNDPTKKAEEE